MKGDKSLLWDFQLANEGTGDHQTMIIQHVETGFAMAPSAREGGAPVIAVIKGTGSTDTTSPPTIYWQVTPHAFEPPSYGPYGLSKYVGTFPATPFPLNFYSTFETCPKYLLEIEKEIAC